MTSRRIETPLLDLLEESVDQEDALATCSAGEVQLGCVSVSKGPRGGVAVLAYDGTSWTEVSRFEWFWDAITEMAGTLDSHRDEVPVDDVMEPSPTMALPTEHGLDVIFLTSEGVRFIGEADREPWELHIDYRIWPTFTAAVEDLKDEAEMSG